MNRSLLILICDFLLLSLISLANFNEPQSVAAKKASLPAPTENAPVNEALTLALEDERSNRDALNAKLADRDQTLRVKDAENRLLEIERVKLNQQLTNTQTQLASLTTESDRIRQRLEQTTTTLAAREAMLADREQRIRDTQAALQQRENEAKTLAEERMKLREQLASSTATMSGLQKQLSTTDTEAKAAREQLEKTKREAEQLQSKLAQLETTLTAAEREKQIIAGQLGVAQTEARMAREQVDTLRDEVKVVRTEKERLNEQTAKLTEGLETLAKQSVELTEEVRAGRPLAANAIFADAATNRVMTHFQVGKKALLGGEATRQRETRSVLVEQGGQVCALYHLTDTPFSIDGSTDWEWFVATLLRGPNVIPLSEVGFANLDPRVVLVPLTPDQVKQSGARPYKVVDDPAKFPDAVLVGAQGGYYGECRFQIDLGAKDYVKMERRMFSKLVGDFVPSNGDLVFSKSGDLLGIMVNKDYCLLLSSLRMSHTLKTGTAATDQRIRNTLASVSLRLALVPERVR